MNIPMVIAASGVAWATFTTLKNLGQQGQVLLTIICLIATWGISASTFYWIVSVLRKITF
jgi:ABC-type uncharacterized transport system permease subunit